MPAVFEAEWNSRNDEHKTKRPQDLRLAGVFFYSVGWLMGLKYNAQPAWTLMFRLTPPHSTAISTAITRPGVSEEN